MDHVYIHVAADRVTICPEKFPMKSEDMKQQVLPLSLLHEHVSHLKVFPSGVMSQQAAALSFYHLGSVSKSF